MLQGAVARPAGFQVFELGPWLALKPHSSMVPSMRSCTYKFDILPAFEEHGIVYHAAYWEEVRSLDGSLIDNSVRDIYTANSPLTALKYIQFSIARKTGVLPIDRPWEANYVFSAQVKRLDNRQATISVLLSASKREPSISELEQMNRYEKNKREVHRGNYRSWVSAISVLRRTMLSVNRR